MNPVPCWRYLTTSDHQLRPVGPLRGRQSYLLGYRIHHSVCYTALFPTPRVVTTIFPYTEFWPSDVSSRGSLLMYFVFRRLSAHWLSCDSLTTPDWLLAVEIHLSKQIYPDRKYHTLSHDLSSIATSWLLRKQLTVDSICCRGDVLSFRGNMLILSLTIRCSCNVLPFCVAPAMDLNIPAFRHGLPSRCLVMEVLSGNQLPIWLHYSSFQTACYNPIRMLKMSNDNVTIYVTNLDDAPFLWLSSWSSGYGTLLNTSRPSFDLHRVGCG
jgi:hypothetical protein